MEDCKKEFGSDESLTHARQVSALAKRKLLWWIHGKGLSFDTTIAYGPKGKPYFLYNEGLHFSLSHTKEHIALALNDSPIGIDVECLRRYNEDLVRRFFNAREADFLSSAAEKYRDELFTRIWTMKEAYVKFTGEGIADNFKTFSVIPKSLSAEFDSDKIEFDSTKIELDSSKLEFDSGKTQWRFIPTCPETVSNKLQINSLFLPEERVFVAICMKKL